MEKIVEVYDFGRIPYRRAWKLQRYAQNLLIEQKKQYRDGKISEKRQNDMLFFVEHPHVYTLGKSGKSANLLKTAGELKQIDAEFIEIDRGGDITYHGPGQIVAYPILDLDRHFTDVHKYLRYLEEVVIRTCRNYDVKAGRLDNFTGVWTEEQKICALGVRCSRWVTMHGFAFNVNTDLSYFDHIVPCGIKNKSVTSLSKLLNRQVEIKEVKNRLLKNFSEVFDVSVSEKGKFYEMVDKS